MKRHHDRRFYSGLNRDISPNLIRTAALARSASRFDSRELESLGHVFNTRQMFENNFGQPEERTLAE